MDIVVGGWGGGVHGGGGNEEEVGRGGNLPNYDRKLGNSLDSKSRRWSPPPVTAVQYKFLLTAKKIKKIFHWFLFCCKNAFSLKLTIVLLTFCIIQGLKYRRIQL